MQLIKEIKQIKCKALVLFCILIAILGSISAYQYGTASLSFYRVNNILSQWQIQGHKQTKEQYLLAKQYIISALDNQPYHPLYVDVMAQIYEWGAISGYEDSKQALGMAKQYYLQASQLRPSWPVTWASLVMVKWRLQEFDEEMLLYLANASRFGPQKPEVHILYTQLGLTFYNNNNPLLIGIRPQFERHLALGLRNQGSRQAVIEAINNSGLIKQICRWFKHDTVSIIMLLKQCK
jgi:hypothetical protein